GITSCASAPILLGRQLEARMPSPEQVLSILASIREGQERSEILSGSIKAELAAMDVAMLKHDQAEVEEMSVRLHNLIDETIEHKWSFAQLKEKIKKLGD